MTMQRTLKLYKLPETTKTPGFRKLTADDVPEAHKLLADVCMYVCVLYLFCRVLYSRVSSTI